MARFLRNRKQMDCDVSILVVQNDLSLSTLLAEALTRVGYMVEIRESGQDTIERVHNSHFDLLILDSVLPDKSGLDVLKALRESGNRTPVLFLSASNDKQQILEAYESGCDDYVVKPFSLDILICKINAFVRRTKRMEEQGAIAFRTGRTYFDSVHQTLNGQHLSAKESEVLLLLFRNKNQCVERSMILKQIWKEDSVFASRSLAVYINHLRKMLEKDKVKILTVHGKGYKIVDI